MRDEVKNQILKEQVKQLYGLAPLGFVATLLNSTIVFFVMRPVAPRQLLVLWLVSLLTITTLRAALVARFRRVDLDTESAATWANRFTGSLVLAGLAWGSVAWLPFEFSIAHQVFLAFVLGGMAAGASSTFAQVRLGFLAFSGPALLPLVVHFLHTGDPFHLAMGVMVLLFLLLLFRISQHNYKVNLTSLVLRFEKEEMIRNLKQAKNDLEGLYEQLSDEIAAKNEAEAELREYQELLERTVKQRTADLSATNQQLKKEIEERKRVETALLESRERSDLAQKAGRVGVFDWDMIRDRVIWSEELEALFGLKPGESQDSYRQWARRLESSVLTDLEARIRHWTEEKATQVDFEYQFLHTSGEKRWMAATAQISYLEDGRPARMIGTNVDITDLKEIQQRLIAAKDAAEAGNLAKSEFLANMSHEMRTPLAGALGMIRFVLDMDIGEEERHLLEMARRSAESLLRIIGDVLDFARLESSGEMKFEMKPFSVREAVKTAVEVVSLEAVGKGLQLEWQVADSVQMVVADEGRLRQVLVNLLGNAVKFTERGRIDLEVGFAESETGGTDCVLFSVRDTGAGIAPEQLERIFCRFTQVDSSLTRRHGGTGLGLALSRQIVEKSGGRIWVESTLGAGSTFYFTLPAIHCTSAGSTVAR